MRENRTEISRPALWVFVGTTLIVSLPVLGGILPAAAMWANLAPLIFFFVYAVVGLDIGAPLRRLASARRSRPRGFRPSP
jgi:hypothetical protein